ncbi:MAG: hypothetical protein ACRELV_14095 [Longimicrobiales bacterium]
MRRVTVPLLLTAVAVACDRPADDRAAIGAAGAGVADSSFVHRFIVVAASVDSPVALVLETAVRPAGDELLRTARAWIGSGPGWERALSSEWSTPPVRGAARLLPGDGLRLLVDAGGALESLILDTVAPPLRIDLGPMIGAAAGLRRATLTIGQLRLEGTLLHSIVTHGLPDPRAAPSRTPDGEAGGSADARPSLALLMTDDGAYLALGAGRAEPGPGPGAIGTGVLAALSGAVLEPVTAVGASAAAAAGSNASDGTQDDDGGATRSWRVLRADGPVGALQPITRSWVAASGPANAPTLSGVRGTLRVAGRDVRVAGVIIGAIGQ